MSDNNRLQGTHEAARAFLLAKAHFDHTHLGWWVNDVQPCDDDTGWKLLEAFRSHVQTYYFGYKRHDVGVKHAAGELFRLVAVGSADYTYEQACGFVKWYDRLHNRIGRSIGHLFDFHGDGFGDLCDSLPLAGKAIAERCLASNPKSNRPKREGFLEEKEIAQAVQEAHGADWRKFICDGENYVEMALKDQAKKWFLHNLVGEHIPDVAPWNEEEQELLSHLDLGDD